MKRLAALLLLPAAAWCAPRTVPPPTRIVPVTDVLHGVEIIDPYRWLEDGKSPETRAWIDVQARAAREYLSAIPAREAFGRRLAGLMKVDAVSVPTARGARYFFTRRAAGESRASIFVRDGFAGKDRLLVDPARFGQGETWSVSVSEVSADGSVLAYALRKGGEDETEIRLMDVARGVDLPGGLPRGRYFSFEIAPGNRAIYYSRFTAGKGSRIYHRSLLPGAPPDREIFGAGYGPNQNVQVTLSEDGRRLLFKVSVGVPPKKVEIYLQDLAGGGPVRTVVNDIEADFRPSMGGNTLYLWTNWKAPNWRVLAAPLDDLCPGRWKEIVPEGTLPIDGFSAAAGRLFASYLENVAARVRQFDPQGRPLGDLQLPGTGTALTPQARWDAEEVFYMWQSFVSPRRMVRVRVPAGAQDVWFEPPVPTEAREIEVKQVWYRSKDGTRVPMFVLHRKGTPLDGQRPTLLYGYGGFASSATPAFSERVLAWTLAGGVYAVANLRGGGEFGEEWHRAGMFEKKQNVFDDFVGAAEWLIASRYTSPAKLGIIGGSNGGLLVGAAITQRPELFGAVICAAPLLDMLRYHKIGVGSWWASEYGSADDPAQFAYIRKYSPYHNVRMGAKYPAVLFVTGDADTRVDPMHARKMTALMQAATASGNPVLLRYDTEGGHTAGTGVSVERTVEEQADQLAFVAALTGLTVR